MKAFKLRFERAVGQGAALAALGMTMCGGRAESSAPTANAGGGDLQPAAGTSAASAVEPEIMDSEPMDDGGAGGSTAIELEPYPVALLGCFGPEFEDSYYGQCCASAICYTPESGHDCEDAEAALDTLGVRFGSGGCPCGDPRIRGPYAVNPASRPVSDGSCCYVVGSIQCDGRPLLVDGEALVSPLVQRDDWLLSESLA